MPGRLLFVSMYPLAEGNSGPTVRARRLLAALERRLPVDVVEGYRGPRRRAWLEYLFAGRLRGVDGVYVESSTALPSETDLGSLFLAKILGRPVMTYIRDAYQLFPDEYPMDTARQRFSRWAFPLAARLLGLCSTRLAFPSAGLARAVTPGETDPLLLPPGAPDPIRMLVGAGARSLLFVGDLRTPNQGGTNLLAAVDIARRRGADVDLLCVTPRGGEPPPPHPSWLRIERANADEITPLLADVVATVIPRVPGAYNDLAIPIKLMEYLAYGRPIIATDRTETAAIVRRAGAGLIVRDGAEGLAQGILDLCAATSSERATWSRRAHAEALASSWGARADALLNVLGLAGAAGLSPV
jgi:hypothetical protein